MHTSGLYFSFLIVDDKPWNPLHEFRFRPMKCLFPSQCNSFRNSTILWCYLWYTILKHASPTFAKPLALVLQIAASNNWPSLAKQDNVQRLNGKISFHSYYFSVQSYSNHTWWYARHSWFAIDGQDVLLFLLIKFSYDNVPWGWENNWNPGISRRLSEMRSCLKWRVVDPNAIRCGLWS